MTDPILPHFHPLTDTQRTEVERQAFNFFRDHGRKMAMPPAMVEALKVAGVDTRHIEPVEGLERFRKEGEG